MAIQKYIKPWIYVDEQLPQSHLSLHKVTSTISHLKQDLRENTIQ